MSGMMLPLEAQGRLIMFGMSCYQHMHMYVLWAPTTKGGHESLHTTHFYNTTLTHSGLAPLSLPLCIWVETSQQQESGVLSMSIQGHC